MQVPLQGFSGGSASMHEPYAAELTSALVTSGLQHIRTYVQSTAPGADELPTECVAHGRHTFLAPPTICHSLQAHLILPSCLCHGLTCDSLVSRWLELLQALLATMQLQTAARHNTLDDMVIVYTQA